MRLLLNVVVPSSVVVPEELELLEELLLEELELLSELALLEELLEEEPPLLLPLEELAPPLLEPPPPPQAVSIETAMTAARAAAATFFDNLMIEFLPFLICSPNKNPKCHCLVCQSYPPGPSVKVPAKFRHILQKRFCCMMHFDGRTLSFWE